MWYNINIKLYINISVFFTFINTFLVKTKQIIKNLIPQKNGARLFLFFAISIGIFLSVSPAYAGIETLPTDFANTLITTGAKFILLVAQVVIKLTVFFLAFFLKLANYNGFIDAPVVIIGWTMIRDISNMFFVVILLAIAFGTILGIEQYEWKRTMAKFIMAAILINFSRLICGLILDAAHVFTMTFANAVAATAGGNIINMLHLDSVLKMTNSEIAIENSTDIRMDILVAAIMGLMFAVIGMLSIMAYALIMVIRVVVLWVLIILSPLPYIFGVLQKTKSYGDEWWSEFSKHVLVAPIAVFFLWLGFATLGSGDFAGPDLGLSFDSNQESQAATAIGLKKDSKDTSVSISEITTWENMANFIIAIAFLWIGLDQVQKTGVKGASIAGKAQEYSKWAGRKAAWHAPLGGRFWTRQGTAALGRAKFIKGGFDLKQNERAAARDKDGLIGGTFGNSEKIKDLRNSKSWLGQGFKAVDNFAGKYGMNRGVGALTGGIFGDSGGRGDKRAEDWKEAAERRTKRVEESYSTGSTSLAGTTKKRETALLQSDEEKWATKKDEKITGQRQRYEDINNGLIDAEDNQEAAMAKQYAAAQKVVAKSKAKGEVAKDSVESSKELRAAKARDKHEDKLKADGKAFEKDVMKAHERKVEAEEITRVQNRDTAQRKERSRADYYEKKGDKQRANAIRSQAGAAQVEEEAKLFNSRNHDETINGTKTAIDDLKKIQVDPKKTKFKDLSEDHQQKLGKMSNQIVAAITSGFSKGASTGQQNFAEALKQLGWKDGLNEENKGRAMASVLSGRIINDTEDLNDVMEEIKTRVTHGGDEEGKDEHFNQVMRQLDTATKHAANEGALGATGIIKSDYDEDSGRTSYKLNTKKLHEATKNDKGETVTSEEHLKKSISGAADWFAQRIDVRKMQSAAGFANQNLKGEITGFSESQISSFAAIFKEANSNKISQIPSSFWASLGSAKFTNEKGEVDVKSQEQMTSAIVKALGNAQNEARDTMIAAIRGTGLLEKLGDTNKDKITANGRSSKNQNPKAS